MCKWGTLSTVELCEIELKGLTEEQHRKRAKILGLKEDEELVDSCIAPLIQVLNAYGIRTVSSCCGHGKTAMSSIRIDSRNILITPLGKNFSVHLQFPYVGRT